MNLEPLLLVCLVAIPLAMISDRRELTKTNQEWQKAAKALGLLFQRGSWGSQPELSGRINHMKIVVTANPRTKGESESTSIIVDSEGAIDPSLIVRPKNDWTLFKQQFTHPDRQRHEDLFDANIDVEGEEAKVLAVLNQPARQLLARSMRQNQFALERSRLRISEPLIIRHWESLVNLVRQAVRLAAQLALPEDATASALAANALSDPEPAVRERNLECLTALLCAPERAEHYAALSDYFPISEATAAAARAALTDQDLHLQLLGAMLTGGEEGFEVLHRLATADGAPAELRARALVTLTTRFPWQDVEPLVASALGGSSQRVLEAAVTAVGEARAVELLGPVCALAASAGAELAVAIAKTLAALASPESEPTLLSLLHHDAEEVRRAAIAALEQLGTARAVEPLLRLAGALVPSELRGAARAAIRAIQGRLGNVEAGRLALLEDGPGSGALSLTHEAEKSSAKSALTPGPGRQAAATRDKP